MPIKAFKKTRSNFIYMIYNNMAYSRVCGILKFILDNCYTEDTTRIDFVMKCKVCKHKIAVRINEDTVSHFCMFYITNIWSKNTIDELFVSGNISKFIQTIGREYHI